MPLLPPMVVVVGVAEAVEAGVVEEDVTVGRRLRADAGQDLLLRRLVLLRPTGPLVPANVQRILRVAQGAPLRDVPQVQRPRNGLILEIPFLLPSAAALTCSIS